MVKFEPAIAKVLKHEGGYVDNENDPGGETNFGISKRAHPNVDIANLTLEGAKEIYYDSYWKKYGYDHLRSQKLANKLFDISVNVGTKRAHKEFQKAVNFLVQQYNNLPEETMTVAEDGWVGVKSAAAANKLPWESLLYTFQIYMGQFYLSINKPYYIKGWLRRLFS